MLQFVLILAGFLIAMNELKDTPVKVCTVIGFPLGATSTAAKVFETEQAIVDGATEVDMVINIGALKSGDEELVQADIKAVVDAAKGKAITKVIIETALLSNEEKIKACQLAKAAGCGFVKTSIGFATGGATVKASGGVRDRETMVAMIGAGANRIGASAGLEIIKGAKGNEEY